uniref:hypothetical protein n=1 Tax=Mucilaginibacter sp. Bleaf8 TaxID=2834430 RepID=UPI001BCDB1B2|nr:hypothetical protein [Mucilaginibacter sp. Bleaf8]
MKKGNALKFTLGIVAIILGVTLFKHFDFEHLRFAKPALDILYLIVFIASVSLLLKKPKKQ